MYIDRRPEEDALNLQARSLIICSPYSIHYTLSFIYPLITYGEYSGLRLPVYSAGLGLRIIADLRLYRLTLVGDVKERGLNPWIACVPNPVPETRTVAEGYRAQRESYH